MESNPYQSPAEDSHSQKGPIQSSLRLGLIGLSFGVICASVGAFVGGSLGACFYRLFHKGVTGGHGVFGLFGQLATWSDYALFHGTLAVLPLALCGGVFGFVQGIRAGRVPPGVWGIITFAIAGLLVGGLNGTLATLGPAFVIPYFVEGPLASAFFGFSTALVAWTLFRKRMNLVTQFSKQEQITFLLFSLLAIFGSLLILSVMIATFFWGTLDLQLAMQFSAIILLGIVSVIVRSIWKHKVIR